MQWRPHVVPEPFSPSSCAENPSHLQNQDYPAACKSISTYSTDLPSTSFAKAAWVWTTMPFWTSSLGPAALIQAS